MYALNIVEEKIDQSWSIEKITTEQPPYTWEEVFKDAYYELRDTSNDLIKYEQNFGQFYPLKEDLFNAFRYTQLHNVKVVIIGQDPYPQTIIVNGKSVPRAIGLSFSVRREDIIPSSLKNIYKELENSVRGWVRPNHGDLKEWTSQGVLLLNTCLTVRPGQPGSHGKHLWMGLMNKVFRAIATVNPNCIYMLWGQHARDLKPLLGEKSIILEAAHPSGLSAEGFLGCNHFNLANDFLLKQGKTPINWKISTLAELNDTKIVDIDPILAGFDHQPKLVPVDTNLLPSLLNNNLTTKNDTKSPDSKKLNNSGENNNSPLVTQPYPMIPNTMISINKQSLQVEEPKEKSISQPEVPIINLKLNTDSEIVKIDLPPKVEEPIIEEQPINISLPAIPVIV